MVAHSDHLRVNDPLAYSGIVFHQSSLVPSATITISDRQGNVIYHDAVILDQSTTLPSGGGVDYARGVPIPGSNLTMGVFFVHDTGLHMSQVPNATLLITIGSPNTPNSQDKALLRLVRGQSGQSIDKEWTITLNDASDATVLLVTKDAGAQFIWPVAVVLILSLCLTFYFPQRRIWLRIQGNRVQMAALREHYTNIRTDLLGLAKEAERKKPAEADPSSSREKKPTEKGASSPEIKKLTEKGASSPVAPDVSGKR
jgi:cytochrome c biogenesis protein